MKTLNLLLIGLLLSAGASAETFDLSKQRAEVQNINPVPGYKIQGDRIIINPTPKQLVIDKEGRTMPKTAKVTSNIDLTKAAPETYVLTVTPNEVMIHASDRKGEIYARETLRQLMELPGETIPCLTITDTPTIPMRGVVEGFYGTPWSHQVRLSLIDYMGRNKLNTYIYGPKDDPYHSSPNWREPYPADQAAQIRELAEACYRNGVDFVWAIHPGKDIKWNEEDYQNLLHKLNLMYDLGVRGFALFFDDIEGEGTDPNKQSALLNRLNKDMVQAKGDVAPITFCPTHYSRLWADPTDKGPLAIYGRTLDPGIYVMNTGDVVCSDLTKDCLNFFNNLTKRPSYYWWNFPVTDYARNFLMLGPAYGLEPTATANDVVALVSNPMENGEASKVALCGVADYTWNPQSYNALDNWERAMVDIMPECPEAFRTLAIHCADTQTGYRRAESWETPLVRLSEATPAQLDTLRNEFAKMESASKAILTQCNDSLLLKEIQPWVIELGKMGARCRRVLDLYEKRDATPKSVYQAQYEAAMMNDADTTAYGKHKVGTLKIMPFYLQAIEDLRP